MRYGSASLEDLEGIPQSIASTLKDEVPSGAQPSVNQGGGKQQRKTSGPKVMLAEDPSLPTLRPIKVPAHSSEEGSLHVAKPPKVNASLTAKSPRLSEAEGMAERWAGRTPRLADFEEHVTELSAGQYERAVDTKPLTPRTPNGTAVPAHNVDVVPLKSNATDWVSREDIEAAALGITGKTPRGTPRATFSMNAREGASPSGNGKISPSNKSDIAETALVQPKALRHSLMAANDPARLSRKFSWKNPQEFHDASPMAGRFSRQISMARSARSALSGRSISDGDEFVDAPSTMDSEGDMDFEAQTVPIGDAFAILDMDEDTKLNHTALKEHLEAQKHNILPGVERMEHEHYLLPYGSPTQASLLTMEREDEQLTVNIINEDPPLTHQSPVSTILNEGPPTSSTSSGKSETPTRDVHTPVQQSGMERAESHVDVSREASEVFQGVADSNSHVQTLQVVEIPEHGEESQMLSLMATSPTASSLASPSSSPSQAMPSSGHAALQAGTSMVSRCSYSSELISVSSDSEIDSPFSAKAPIFNALYSPPVSPSRTSRDMIDSPPRSYIGTYSPTGIHSTHSSPSPTEIPILSGSPTSPSTSPYSIPIADWGDEVSPLGPSGDIHHAAVVISRKPELTSVMSQTNLQLYPLPSPPRSPPLELSTSPTSRDINYPSKRGSGGPTSSEDNAGSTHTKSSPGSPSCSEVPHSPTQRMEGKVLENTSIVPQRSPVIHSEANMVSTPPRSTTPTPSFTELVRSSLLLPCRPADSPGSSAPVSPVGSPKKSFQRIFLSSPSILATRSPVGSADEDAPSGEVERDEESAPSSPSGSVIIKDSPPESPSMFSSESESESHDFDAPFGHPQAPELPELTDSALEEPVIAQEPNGETTLSGNLRPNSSDNVSASFIKLQQHSPVSYPLPSLSDQPEDPVEPQSDVSGGGHIPWQIDPRMASPPHVAQSATQRSISAAKWNTWSQNSVGLNSLQRSQSKEEIAAREGETSNFQWLGRLKPVSPPMPEFILPSARPVRSLSNSPLSSPPKSLLSESSSLKWHGRSDPSPPSKPKFSLPPNLVCRSETSSPPCSPTPRSIPESPKTWVARSENEDGSPPESPYAAAANVDSLHSQDLPIPDAQEILENGHCPPGHSPRSHLGREPDDEGECHKPKTDFTATRSSGPRSSSSSTSKSLADLPSLISTEVEDTLHSSMTADPDVGLAPIPGSVAELPSIPAELTDTLQDCEEFTTEPSTTSRVVETLQYCEKFATKEPLSESSWVVGSLQEVVESVTKSPPSPSPATFGRADSLQEVEGIDTDPPPPCDTSGGTDSLQEVEGSSTKSLSDPTCEGTDPHQEDAPVSELPRVAASNVIMDHKAEDTPEIPPSSSIDVSVTPPTLDDPLALPAGPGFELRKTPSTQDALAAAIVQHDRNMVRIQCVYKELCAGGKKEISHISSFLYIYVIE